MDSKIANPTYLDLMALATALTQRTKLRADSEDWSRAWSRAVSLPGVDELFSDVTFETREPYAPLSDQVEALIRSLSRAGILSLHNPRYRYYTIEDQDKELIRTANAELLSKHRALLEQVAHILDEELAAA